MDRAVKAARAAFEGWREVTAQERGRILFRLAQKMRDEVPRLAELETRNSGKPIVESEFDLGDVATCFEYYGGLATKLHGEVLNVPDNAISLALREPLGVAGQIIPWNYPLLMAAWKLAPALCAGCTTVIKPAEQTPVTLLEFAKFFEECGLPKGVVNVITGFGESAGAPLVAHKDVDKIAFTGSMEVGKKIMRVGRGHPQEGQPRARRASPPTSSSPTRTSSRPWTGRSSGSSSTRGRSARRGAGCSWSGPYTRRCWTRWWRRPRGSSSGNGMERETKMGPVVSREQMERVMRYQEIGKKEAKVADGRGPAPGRRPPEGLLRGAHDLLRRGQLGHHRPRGDLRAGHVRHPLRHEADALRIANDTPYGLAAAVWSRDIFKCLRAVKKLEAGIVWVNHMQPTYVEAPWGGYKMSGIGRELGPWGAEEYLQVKQVHINLNEQPVGWY